MKPISATLDNAQTNLNSYCYVRCKYAKLSTVFFCDKQTTAENTHNNENTHLAPHGAADPNELNTGRDWGCDGDDRAGRWSGTPQERPPAPLLPNLE